MKAADVMATNVITVRQDTGNVPRFVELGAAGVAG